MWRIAKVIYFVPIFAKLFYDISEILVSPAACYIYLCHGFSVLVFAKIENISDRRFLYRPIYYLCTIESTMPMKRYSKEIYVAIIVIAAICLFGSYVPGLHFLSKWCTPPVMLFLGLAYALLCGQGFPGLNKKMSKVLLQYSVVGLGFGMNLYESLASGREGMLFTIVSVVGTLVIGMLIGRKLLKVDKETAYLISSGTAICGGSAIAAVGPVIKAKPADMSVALAVVFVLNAIALFVFPSIGHWLGLSQQEFGTWAAIAIHDTSSVVGAGAAYGEEALKVATTIKLTRALWIIPVALVTSFIFKSQDRKITIPWFILYFIIAILLNTFVLDSVPAVGIVISGIARRCLTLTMFFIGASLSTDVLRTVGFKPFIQGIMLWAVISVGSLLYIIY